MKFRIMEFSKSELFIALLLVSSVLIAGMFLVFNFIDKNKNEHKDFLVKTAQTHYEHIISIRAWNASFDGVYVKQKNGLKPNQYLKNNHIFDKDGKRLIKINPAWMTRMLSEIERTDEFNFRITSLKPINPINKPDAFETKALTYLEKNLSQKDYYEIDEVSQKLLYMGKLSVVPSCLPCHAQQGYKVGEIRGGIRITLDAKTFFHITEFLRINKILIAITVLVMITLVALLLYGVYRRNLFIKNQNIELEKKVKTRTHQLKLAKEATMESMGIVAEHRDPETGGHIQRTKKYMKLLASELAQNPKYADVLTSDIIDLIYNSAPLHDIGKVAISDIILLKAGKLNRAEYEVMKKHASIGEETIDEAQSALGENSFLDTAKDIAGSHHEKWNGRGYPRGLKGDEIPLSGRLMALADVFDALISKRTYKPPYDFDDVVKIILNEKGRQFDPDIVDAFLKIKDDFRQIAEEFSEN